MRSRCSPFSTLALHAGIVAVVIAKCVHTAAGVYGRKNTSTVSGLPSQPTASQEEITTSKKISAG